MKSIKFNKRLGGATFLFLSAVCGFAESSIASATGDSGSVPEESSEESLNTTGDIDSVPEESSEESLNTTGDIDSVPEESSEESLSSTDDIGSVPEESSEESLSSTDDTGLVPGKSSENPLENPSGDFLKDRFVYLKDANIEKEKNSDLVPEESSENSLENPSGDSLEDRFVYLKDANIEKKKNEEIAKQAKALEREVLGWLTVFGTISGVTSSGIYIHKKSGSSLFGGGKGTSKEVGVPLIEVPLIEVPLIDEKELNENIKKLEKVNKDLGEIENQVKNKVKESQKEVGNVENEETNDEKKQDGIDSGSNVGNKMEENIGGKEQDEEKSNEKAENGDDQKEQETEDSNENSVNNETSSFDKGRLAFAKFVNGKYDYRNLAIRFITKEVKKVLNRSAQEADSLEERKQIISVKDKILSLFLFTNDSVLGDDELAAILKLIHFLLVVFATVRMFRKLFFDKNAERSSSTKLIKALKCLGEVIKWCGEVVVPVYAVLKEGWNILRECKSGKTGQEKSREEIAPQNNTVDKDTNEVMRGDTSPV